MKTIDVVASIRNDVSVLSNKLISSARPGHVAYISKVDAGHTLARIERELDSLIATLKGDQCFCDQLNDSWCTVCLRKEQEWAEGLAKVHGV